MPPPRVWHDYIKKGITLIKTLTWFLTLVCISPVILIYATHIFMLLSLLCIFNCHENVTLFAFHIIRKFGTSKRLCETDKKDIAELIAAKLQIQKEEWDREKGNLEVSVSMSHLMVLRLFKEFTVHCNGIALKAMELYMRE